MEYFEMQADLKLGQHGRDVKTGERVGFDGKNIHFADGATLEVPAFGRAVASNSRIASKVDGFGPPKPPPVKAKPAPPPKVEVEAGEAEVARLPSYKEPSKPEPVSRKASLYEEERNVGTLADIRRRMIGMSEKEKAEYADSVNAELLREAVDRRMAAIPKIPVSRMGGTRHSSPDPGDGTPLRGGKFSMVVNEGKVFSKVASETDLYETRSLGGEVTLKNSSARKGVVNVLGEETPEDSLGDDFVEAPPVPEQKPVVRKPVNRKHKA